MGPLISVENANVSKINASQLMRNASSLSTESSEFEFDFHDEPPPLSPKLLYCPNHTPNLFLHGESVLKVSANQSPGESDHTPNRFLNGETLFKPSSDQYCPQRDCKHEGLITPSAIANLGQNRLISSLYGANSEGEDGNAQIMGAFVDDKQELRGKFEHISVDNHTGNDNYEGPASVSRANHDVNGDRKGTNLRSLLNRRDLEQLAPLSNCSNYQNKKEIVSASAVSPSSSPLNYHTNQSSNPCKLEDDHLDYAGAASPPESKCGKKKSCRKWAFKLDFLKKSPSPRADQALLQTSKDDHAVYSPSRDINTIQHDQCTVSAAADETGFDSYSPDNGAATAGEAGISRTYQVNQKIDHYHAAAAASEARFHRMINQSINVNYRAAADHAAKEGRFYQQINQSIDHYHVASGVITKYESPRQSTCSVISSISSSPRHADNELIKANHRKISRSVPISPAASPPRSSYAAGDQVAFTRGRAPMSPHALYQEQKARAEEHRRKTFLPYRQSLLGACFFPPSTHPHHPQQAVY